MALNDDNPFMNDDNHEPHEKLDAQLMDAIDIASIQHMKVNDVKNVDSTYHMWDALTKNDPDREYIYAAVNRISTEFHKSGAYEKLPNTAEEGDKKNRESGDVFSDAEDEDDEGFDLKNWSPLTEVYDSMPTFSVGA